MAHMDRRQLLMGGAAGVLGLAAAALGPSSALADEGESEGPMGTWDIQVTDATAQGGPSTFEAATTFAPGGGVVNIDATSPSPGLGSWSGRENGAFMARFMQFSFNSFNPADTSTVKLVVAIDGKSSGNTISGTFTYVVYALNGSVLFPSGKGSFTGTRFAAA